MIHDQDKQQHVRTIQDATLLEILLNNLPDTIYFKDAQGRFIKVNEQQAKILGLASSEEAIGLSDFDFFPEAFAHAARQDEIKIMDSGKPMSSKLERLKGPDGQVKWLSATKAPIQDSSGNSIGIVGLSRDVTERQELDESIDELNSLRELLLDIITHDLKNPAGVIHSMADLMIEDAPEDEFLKTIHMASKSLLSVLESTTILSQATFGEQIPMQELDLSQVISDICDEFSLALTQAKMELTRNLPETLPVKANPLIAEIFKNYISNAIKYARSGKLIHVKAQQSKTEILVQVQDLGTTIAEDSRQAIFDRRNQLEGELKNGRGLGLAIVKRIASAHGGQVWVEPNAPQGNVFCLRLPL